MTAAVVALITAVVGLTVGTVLLEHRQPGDARKLGHGQSAGGIFPEGGE